MSENHSKSKLKRKKLCVEDQQPEKCFRGMSGHTTTVSGDGTAEPRRSELCAGPWWTREQMSAVGSLWALTLQSSLSHVESQHRYLVPDLPHPSSVRVTALKLDDQRWCELSEEVAPFPELSRPSPRMSSSRFRLSSSQQDLSVQPAPDSPDRQILPDSRQSRNGKTRSLQALTKRPDPTLHSLEEGAASSSASDRRVSLQEKSGNEEEVVSDGKEEEVQRSVRGDEAGLQSCPMCLLVFPAGFTQMDCDGHLAQCLSEVNVDVTW